LEAIEKFKLVWREKTNNTEFYFNDFKEFNKYNQDRPYRAFSVGPIAKLINSQEDTNTSKLISYIYERVQAFQNIIVSNPDSKINLKFNRNTISAILGINSFDNSLLFFGDATSDTIEASLDDIPKRSNKIKQLLFNPNFVKVSHHGSKYSTKPEIWDKLLTEENSSVLFGISAGDHKKNKHPYDEFYVQVNKCCEKRKIKNYIYRTNERNDCSNKQKIDGEIDLDFWFQFHGCKIEDIRLQEAFDNESIKIVNNSDENNCKNLLAFVFDFPCNGKCDEIKIYRGVSSGIKSY
jgi:hypothetical protein